MFNASKIYPVYKNLIGWRQHFDNTIQIGSPLTVTDSGEYYQQKHSALSLDVIQTLIPATYDLEEYLENTVKDSINEIFNDLIQYRHLNEYGKTLLEQSVLLNRYGWTQDTITNQGRFVGFKINVRDVTGLKAVINQIGFQFVGTESFDLYLFHTSKKDPIETLSITLTGGGNWEWKESNFELSAFSHLEFNGGAFIVGYYQDDITSNAINYTNFNWDIGVCGGCNDNHSGVWKSIRNNFFIYPMYVPAGSFVPGEMFDLQKAIFTNNESFGLNYKFSVVCDLTDFFIQNKMVFKNLLGIKVVHKVLEMMKFSQQINSIEENIKMMIIRDLEGDIDTKLKNIPTRYDNELKAVSFNISGINEKCLGCKDENVSPRIGNV